MALLSDSMLVKVSTICRNLGYHRILIFFILVKEFLGCLINVSNGVHCYSLNDIAGVK